MDLKRYSHKLSDLHSSSFNLCVIGSHVIHTRLQSKLILKYNHQQIEPTQREDKILEKSSLATASFRALYFISNTTGGIE